MIAWWPSAPPSKPPSSPPGGTQKKQSDLTDLTTKAGDKLRLLLSHFIQIFNLAVDRGEFAASDRALYLLSVTDGTVPDLETGASLLTWAGNLVAGEAARLLANPGAQAMDLPSAAQVQTALDTYNELSGLQSGAKTANDTAEKVIASLRPEADEVIRKVWNDIEHTFEDDEPPSLRDKAREYGVIYALRPTDPPDPTDPPANPTPTDPPANPAPEK